MRSFKTLLLGVGIAGVANAAEVLVTSDIAVSTTWTADNTYNLQDQIYVLPGATLTIEAGVVVASETGLGGSLAVTKGAQIMVLGTVDAPVIMTSKADVATWAADGSHPTGGDPTTGTWREAANEWGNLTIMGDAFISENATPGNVPTCDAGNVAAMEGLVEDFAGDPKVLYGGGNDDDDSGTINYLSIRFGGRVIGLNNELNGLSMGGIGRETDVNYVEIMNNVDDGIEIWGGTLEIKHFSIWNVGDDSFDVDQGWRGRAQFGLIVQGYSLDASQGSGVGDNCFETDGAEDSDWQPVTTTTIYNCTVVGQPIDGDQATAWRDNARVQYRNCVFMDIGDEVVKFDNDDGDGANGYGHGGTLSWADTWTTDFDSVPAHANDCPPGTYQTQFSGKLAEITDSVFFRNLGGSAYTEANARGVFDAANDNVLINSTDDADSPITTLTRGAPVVRGTKTMLPVQFIDPSPKNEALLSIGSAPNDGFWTPAQYRGAFAPGQNWQCGWTAAEAFDLTGSDDCCPDLVYCTVDSGAPFNTSTISISSCSLAANPVVTMSGGPDNFAGYLLVGEGTGVAVSPPDAVGDLCVLGGCLGRYTADLQVIGNAGFGMPANGPGQMNTDLINGPVGGGVGSLPATCTGQLSAGQTWTFQYWHRQPMMQESTFSEALQVTFSN